MAARIGRVAFLGTGDFAVPLLDRLPQLADELLVVSAPDRPAGRHLRPRPSPVAVLARERNLPLVTPRRLRSEEGREVLRLFAPDGLLLAAYGQLVPGDILALGSRPPLNVHPSLLPRHRGAAPGAGTILAGDSEAGLSLMVMTPELDAGPLVAQWRVPLDGREQAPELETRLAELAAREVPELLLRWARGELPASPQDEAAATVTHQLTRDDGRIDWSADSATIDRQVRALQPWPGAWTMLDGERLHVRRAAPEPAAPEPAAPEAGSGSAAGAAAQPGTLLPGLPPRVACGTGVLRLEVVQPAGRPPMPADAWLRGLRRERVQLATPTG